MRVYYVHWNEREADAHARTLALAGHAVAVHASTEEPPGISDPPPEALVVSLERLPDEGKKLAAWFRHATKAEPVPIVFVGGEPGDVAQAKEAFAGAKFCARDDLVDLVGALDPKKGQRAR